MLFDEESTVRKHYIKQLKAAQLNQSWPKPKPKPKPRIKNQESRSILNLISIGNRISVDQTIRTASLDSCPQKPTNNNIGTKLRMSRKKKLAEEKL